MWVCLSIGGILSWSRKTVKTRSLAETLRFALAKYSTCQPLDKNSRPKCPPKKPVPPVRKTVFFVLLSIIISIISVNKRIIP